MIPGIVVFLAASLLLAGDEPGQIQPKNAKLRDELLERFQSDQDARKKLMQFLEDQKSKPSAELLDVPAMRKVREIDRQNCDRLKEIIEENGWPGKTFVGERAAHAAWLLVQHADHDPAFQKRCLGLLAEAVKAKEAAGADLAYLTDRVRIAEKMKQLYGTQLQEKDGKLQPMPIEDEAHVDERRREIGLPPLADYLKFAAFAQKSLKAKDKPTAKP